MGRPAKYLYALRFRALDRIYDPVARWTTRERRIKGLLVAQVAAGEGRALDIGCGTATLLLLLRARYSQAPLVGFDGDRRMLAIARRKLQAAGATVALVEGLAGTLPFAAASFDRVVSSLAFHHFNRETKRRALAEIRRVLRPGGELHVADWGRPQNLLMRAAFLGVQLLDGFATTASSVRGELVGMMAAAGLVDVAETCREWTMFGTMSLYRARRP
ncbi:MAG: class I SAM-dependent methyltransferase [Planctomycetota bacterium]